MLIILQVQLWVPRVHCIIFCTFKYIRNFFVRNVLLKRENILSSIFWHILVVISHDLRNSVFTQPTNDKTNPPFPGGKDIKLPTWLVDLETIQVFKQCCFHKKSLWVTFYASPQDMLEFDSGSLSPLQPEMLPDWVLASFLTICSGFNNFIFSLLALGWLNFVNVINQSFYACCVSKKYNLGHWICVQITHKETFGKVWEAYKFKAFKVFSV